MKRRSGFGVVLAALVVLVATACGGVSDSGTAGAGNSTKLTLVAYSTPKEAYEALIPAFQKTTAGKGVSFDQSYASSGEQSRAVEAGLPADVVEFSLEPDMTRLVDAGIVDSSWNSNQYKGMVTDSVVVFVVRKGNPEGIKTWDDLVKPGIEVITPNPFTSGGARWNLMAAYGAQIEEGKTEQEALDYVRQLLSQTPVQDKSAREALQTFVGGKGDVMLAYENEAITAARGRGRRLRRPRPDDPDREPRRGHEGRAAGGAGLRRLPAQRRGPEDLRGEGLSARGRKCAPRDELPEPARTLHDREVRRLGHREGQVLRSRQRARREDRARPGGVHG